MEFNFKRRLAIVMTMIMLLSFAGPAWARGGPEDGPCEEQIVIINGYKETPVPPQLTRDPDTGVWTLSVTLDRGEPSSNALSLKSDSGEEKNHPTLLSGVLSQDILLSKRIKPVLLPLMLKVELMHPAFF